MKKILSFVLVLILCFGSVNAFAYNYPSAFWGVNAKYEAAYNSKNYRDIIKYGKEIIAMFSNRQSTYETRQILGSRYREVAWSYSMLGDYDSSLYYYKLLYALTENYSNELNNEWNMLSENAITHYTSEVTMYTDGGESVYYGAKNEPENGVLFGTNADGKVRTSGAIKNESMILTYQELGQDMLPYNTGVFRTAKNSGCAVEYALNCPKEGINIRNIKNYESQLKKVSELFSNYSDVPVFLRFAAEFDVWSTPTDAQSFISAFRYVSQYFKSRNSNVAIVWSPNQVSAYGTDHDDYYPGDSYVDWIGVSSYAKQYYQSNKYQTEYDSLFFKSGKNSNPVVVLKDIVETYGDRKPIMLSESGAGHYVYSNVNADTTSYALEKLMEYYYYIPMVYPQVKLMAHFDHYVSGGTEDYRLSSNNKLKNAYITATKSDRFIQNSFDSTTDFCYRKVTDGTAVEDTFPVSTYAYAYNSSITCVTYYIDGNYAATSYTIPYTVHINSDKYTTGAHTLSVRVATSSGKILTTESTIYINGSGTGTPVYNTTPTQTQAPSAAVPKPTQSPADNIPKPTPVTTPAPSQSKPITSQSDISVKVGGKAISFSQAPVMYNDNTLVSMREIFEALGASVSWNEKTQTATATKGSRKVKITVGESDMYINDRDVELETPAIMVNGSVMVPVRAIAESLGATVSWNGNTKTVSIEPPSTAWSAWSEYLPLGIENDLFDIEVRYEYRYRDYNLYQSEFVGKTENYVGEEISYTDWSAWSTEWVSSNVNREVQTRNSGDKIEYRYRDIIKVHTYYTTTDWSGWSSSMPELNLLREVQTRAYYRYKAK